MDEQKLQAGNIIRQNKLKLPSHVDFHTRTAAGEKAGSRRCRRAVTLGPQSVSRSEHHGHIPAALATSMLRCRRLGAGGSLPARAAGAEQWQQPLRLPGVAVTEMFWKARCQRTYAAAHTYHINSISVNSDQVGAAAHRPPQ